jgi:hypothetical protein
MKIEQKLKIGLAKFKDDVFLRQEFERYASRAYVAKGLQSLVRQGILVKLGKGIYAKSKISALSGKPIPSKPLEVLAPLALKKMGVDIKASTLVKAYNLKESTQIPAGIVIDVGNNRIKRQIGFGTQSVIYEKNKHLTN